MDRTADRPAEHGAVTPALPTRSESRPRRAPEQRGGQDDEKEAEEQIGPKLIQWNGRVNGEREITIELPGLPGTIEIPRAYRDRVGVIDPPSAGNRWCCAVLRVFGRGNISFIVRWWPMPSRPDRISAR
jgi:hypothetical protein